MAAGIIQGFLDKYRTNKKIADIIIPHHDRHDLLKKCLDGIDNSIFNIIIISGGTFAENCNKGARVAETDVLIFLNDDVEAKTEPLIALANTKEDYCGATQYIERETSGSVKYFGLGWRETNGKSCKGWFLADNVEDFFIPAGYCMKFKKEAWNRLNGLNEKYRNGFEDVDIGLRALDMGLSIGFIDTPMKHENKQSNGRFKREKDNQSLFDKNWTMDKIIQLRKLCHE